MASRFFALNEGQTENDVVEGAATASEAVELKVDLTANMNREEVLRAMEYIRNYILRINWPPA